MLNLSRFPADTLRRAYINITGNTRVTAVDMHEIKLDLEYGEQWLAELVYDDCVRILNTTTRNSAER